MSRSTPRVTRSSARLQADSTSPDDEDVDDFENPPTPHTDPSNRSLRKRKAELEQHSPASRESRRPKRSRGVPPEQEPPPHPAELSRKGRKTHAATMSASGSEFPPADAGGMADPDRPSSGTSADTSPQQVPRDSSRRKSSRRKSKEGESGTAPPAPPPPAEHGAEASGSGSAAASSRKSRRSSKKDQDVVMKDVDEKKLERLDGKNPDPDAMQQDSGGGGEEGGGGGGEGRGEAPDGGDTLTSRFGQDDLDAMDRGDDPFTSGYLSRFGGHAGLTSSLRALSGIVSGTHGRLRNILEQLRAKDDASVQLIALQELSELLLVSNEDNLAGHFAPDQYVKELVQLMQPNDFTGEENPEIMLLACRCIANMMEALPASTASVVYGGAVPVLCQKLLEIHFIDLAEQALSTLEKISVEFPSSIVREGGLTACLTYLDFFATSTQRTAVTTAANCCRNIPEDSFPTVRDVMPILLNTLSSSDQRVVEQASLCVSRVIDSFKYHESKLEELVSPELLQAILRLLLPGSTNMIGPNIHTQFLRVLSITARASPRLCVELLKMNVVDTLYQILAGVSPPAMLDDAAAKIDKNVIMQSIIRTPREQIFETLNVICEILPTMAQETLMFLDELQDAGYTGARPVSMSTRSKTSPNDKKQELLRECPDEVKRFAVILFPTLMYAFTSTVNLSVRQKALTAQLKMLSNFDTHILEDSLRGVTYSSHLASILSQQENESLVTFAMQAAELLLKRLESVYRPQFQREGVMAEITKLAERPLKADATAPGADKQAKAVPGAGEQPEEGHDGDEDVGAADSIDVDVRDEDLDMELHEGEDQDGGENDEQHNDQEDDDEDDDDEDDDEDDNDPERSADSDISSRASANRPMDLQDVITLRAKRFMDVHGGVGSEESHNRASAVLADVQSIAAQLRECYGGDNTHSGTPLFKRLARHFDGDAFESITSYEIMTSGIVDALLDVFNSPSQDTATRARFDFLEVFMSSAGQAKVATGDAKSPLTAFSVLVHKLQELLSRAEHFEVITVHHNAFESNRGSPASMLAKQLRLKLVADDDSGIPRHFRNIMVSIHAIAKFSALDDYLRPRISLAERPRNPRSRENISSAMAAYAAAMINRSDRTVPSLPSLPALGNALPTRSASKKSARTRSSKTEVTSQGEPSREEHGIPMLRRSSRRHSGNRPSDAEIPVPGASAGSSQEKSELQEALECADEARISADDDEDDDDDDDVEADLDALVDDLEEGGLERDVPEPSAVNLEVANSGKVTARTEDGTRVATPSQGAPTPTTSERASVSARMAAARELLASTTPSDRPMSYASALQQTPQDWHIAFTVHGMPIPSDDTIWRVCRFNAGSDRDREVSSRNMWTMTHTIGFKRVQGPPADRSSKAAAPVLTPRYAAGSHLPPSLDKHPITSGILRLMSILHDLNANLDDVLSEHKTSVKLNREPRSSMVNTKLTAKLNRQLEEPLIVASQSLPTWSEDLARLYPFLFPFETRHLFLQSTSFGYSRLMSRWQSSQPENDSRRHRDERPFLGRVQRQKVRIARSRVLESAIKVMELYGASSSILEVEYFEEVGTGLGPTLEFYSTVSKEFSKKKTKLWRENESNDGDEFAFGKFGLFPAPMSKEMAENDNGKRVLHLFKMLGKFVARSMLDSRIIDVSFNPIFFRIGDGAANVIPSLGAIATVDQDLAKALKILKKYVSAKQRIDEDTRMSVSQKAHKIGQIRVNDARVDDLGLDFTLPGYPHIELVPSGAETNVTIDNVGDYIKRVIDFTLGEGVQRQVDAFAAGFSLVFPFSALRAFAPDELVMLFGRVEEDWSLETLMDSIKADHGYNLDSKSVRNLLQVMSELDPQGRRDFLQFVTGSPKLPIGGFKALTPMFTVVCKPSEPPYTSDAYLPSVMTCVNYLKMPDYTSLEIMREKLTTAIQEGQGAFHLS